MPSLPRSISLLAGLLLAAPAAAQSGTLDQVCPFGSETPGTGASSASFNFDATSLTWQSEVEAGMSGTLEGFELELTGAAGATLDVAIFLGSPWQAGTPAWSGTISKPTGGTDLVFADASSAGINLNAGDRYSIQITGSGTGIWGTGSYLSPNNNLYPHAVFLNGSAYPPEWRWGFHTYMLSGPQLSSSGACGGAMTFTVSGATPGNVVAFLYSRNLGSYIWPSGPCAGTELGIMPPIKLADVQVADAAGNASTGAFVPAAACGLYYAQGVDVGKCTPTNVLPVL